MRPSRISITFCLSFIITACLSHPDILRPQTDISAVNVGGTRLSAAGTPEDAVAFRPLQADIVCDPPSWNFGSIVLGKSGSRIFTLSNAGSGGSLTLTGLSITGADAGRFSIQKGIGDPVTLAPGEIWTLTVDFSPDGTADRNAELDISSDDPDENPLKIPLHGAGREGGKPIWWKAAAPDGGGIFHSTDDGLNWQPFNTGMEDAVVPSLMMGDICMRAGTWGKGVFGAVCGFDALRSGKATGWGDETDNITDLLIRSIAVFPGRGDTRPGCLIAGTENGHIWWHGLNEGFDILIDGAKDNFYGRLTGTDNGRLHLRSCAWNSNGAPESDDDLSAEIWTAWSKDRLYLYEEVRDDAVSGEAVNVWEEDCLELKIDPQPTDSTVFGMAINQHDNDSDPHRSATVQWAAVLNDAVYMTPKYLGTVELLAEYRLRFTAVNHMTGVTNPVPYDGSDYTRTRIKETDTRPSTLALSQNYPNPFNPSTTIFYSLPVSSEVRLSVIDILGREVSVPVHGIRKAGVHEVTFKAGRLASGIYF